ncbi:DNA adenine methylase [Nocardioides sp. GY 10127]|uniref:DNA adenine methylase n=1 Tax=Nocardioides sp. GY 10127 TaxID=2569762 RepID=UPI0010A7652B|nr:DNA adenine methylase [Nocardioides sp. GY 10127]TIC81692.1 DNA methyltransferase [Nocardioides sp. GY 10127]
MIKYLGSKRALVPVLGDLAEGVGARTAIDLFTGTTRVAQELKRRGLGVTAADVATYSQVLSDCYVATDAREVDEVALAAALEHLASLPGERGYFTETFCEASRFLQPHNGRRVDAVRNALEREYRDSPLFPVLLTSLLLAADRVDSTTGLQMAYLKQWAPRSFRDLDLRRPELLPGPGRTVAGDVMTTVDDLGPADLAYLDPPYNQHRYFTNYHVWETLVRWDAPEPYGVACKRADARDPATKSVFNVKRQMPGALASVLERLSAEVVVLSYNDESWLTSEQMTTALLDAGHEDVRLLAFDSKRYVGAQIGIFSPAGEKVGRVSHLRNTEYVFVAGPTERVEAGVAAVRARQPQEAAG